MMDTDTILNARPLKEVWAKFDCARKGKPILMGGETSCWFGVQCKAIHIRRYYEPLGPTLNAFINSGYIMGSLPALQVMFSFIANNYAFFRRFIHWVHWFCDQSAFTYFYGNNRDMVQIDEHQQVFATLSAFMDSDVGRHMVCRSHLSNQIVSNCIEVLYPQHIFSLDPATCILTTTASKITNKTSYLIPIFSQKSPDPIVFHGNARGKRIGKVLTPLVTKCLMKKYKIKHFSGDLILDQ
jgi:hypothetical protein